MLVHFPEAVEHGNPFAFTFRTRETLAEAPRVKNVGPAAWDRGNFFRGQLLGDYIIYIGGLAPSQSPFLPFGAEAPSFLALGEQGPLRARWPLREGTMKPE